MRLSGGISVWRWRPHFRSVPKLESGERTRWPAPMSTMLAWTWSLMNVSVRRVIVMIIC
jgi:hypothetical protein